MALFETALPRARCRPAVCAALLASSAASAWALDCPALPQQVSRDTEVEVRVGVAGLRDARGAELDTRTRRLTTDLLGKLPKADQVYLEQMLFAAYCSTLRDNAGLTEAERGKRIAAYGREVRATLASGGDAPAAKGRTDPRDAARADLARVPVDYTPAAFVAAARRGDLRVVKLFIAAGLDVSGVNADGETALAYAADRGDLPMMQALLKAGAPPDQRVGNGGTALSWAAGAGRLDAMRRLLAKPAAQESIDTAFEVAAQHGHADALDLLIARGADLKRLGAKTLNLMPTASPAGRLAVVRRLVAAGVLVDEPEEDGGRTLLVYAASAPALDIAAYAIEAGADVNRRCDCGGYLEGGYTPIAIAARGADVALMTLLLEHGATVTTVTKTGQTPLKLAAGAQDERADDAVALLLARGADPNQADAEGVTPLMEAARQSALIPRLLAAGARVNAATPSGYTALIAAARYGNGASARLLLEAGASVDARTTSGRTALAVAARNGYPDVARVLLEHQARADIADEDGKTALAYARELVEGSYRTQLIALLSAAGAPR